MIGLNEVKANGAEACFSLPQPQPQMAPLEYLLILHLKTSAAENGF